MMMILVSIVVMPHVYVPDTMGVILRLSFPIGMCIVFFTNYYWLAPKFFHRRSTVYVILNLLLMFVTAAVTHYCMLKLYQHELPPGKDPLNTWDEHMIYILRNMVVLLLSAGVATLTYMSVRWSRLEMEKQNAEIEWQQAEMKRQEAEMGRVEAELKMLQTQVSPHVMLNTLNNIYALIQFDKEKAQKAVISLSKVLGYILYTRKDNTINLMEDMELIQHFIDLMKIRLTDNVKVDVKIDIPTPCNIQVAPFIFVPLIENAFKYGISPTAASFINISVTADEQQISFCVSNSYQPGGIGNQSSNGVGTEQVSKRLQLLYPGKYQWEKGFNKNKEVYTSKIIIYDTHMCHH